MVKNTDIMSFVSVFVMILAVFIYRAYIHYKNNILDEGIQSESDFTIFVLDLPVYNIEDTNNYDPKK